MEEFEYKRRSYERPNQRWECGAAGSGEPCKTGPDSGGGCRASYQCIPRRQGDRWFCTKEEPCEDGPMPDGACSRPIPPCRPTLSLRARRARAVTTVLALCVGALLLTLYSEFQKAVFLPGPLSFAHGATTQRCVDCLTAAEDPNLFQWAAIALTLSPPGPQESNKCLRCHGLGDDGLAVHNLGDIPRVEGGRSGGVLLEDPLRFRMMDALFGVNENTHKSVNCNLCHKEHHGNRVIRTIMDDDQCQSCHRRRFAGFEEGHPEFSAYPYTRRTRIRFNHVSHLYTHFENPRYENAAPARCRTCHVTDANGRLMEIRSFEQTCAACHLGQIRGEGAAGGPGVKIFNIPGLDLETLKENGIRIGQWPGFAEEPLGPIMSLWLEGEVDVPRLNELDLLDLSGAPREELLLVQDLAWAIKEKLHRVKNGGQRALIDQLSENLGGAFSEKARSAFAGALSYAVVESALNAWFPDLEKEMEIRRLGKEPPETVDSDDAPITTDEPPASVADDNLASTSPGDGDAPVSSGDSGNDPLSGSDGDLLAGAGDDLLTDADDDLLTGTEDGLPADAEEDLSPDEAESTSIMDSARTEESGLTRGDSAAPTPVSQEAWVSSGGWYRKYTALFYRPTGHADPYLKAWFDAISALPEKKSARKAFERFASLNDPGRCLKCHSHDAQGENPTVNWRAGSTPPGINTFIRYSHTPHFSLAREKGCMTCHAIKRAEEVAASFSGAAGDGHVSDFEPIRKDACARCHRPDAAGDNCRTCHNYHIGKITYRMPATVVEHTGTRLSRPR